MRTGLGFDITTGKLNFGGVGPGTPPDLLSEVLRLRAGFDYEPVAYRGMAPALAALLGGQIDFTNPSILAVKQFIDTGRMKGIAVTGKKRLPQAPNVPTFAEGGIDVAPLSDGTWWGLFAPVATPIRAVHSVNEGLRRAVSDPKTRRKLEEGGYAAAWLPQSEFATQLRVERDAWNSMVPHFRT